MEKETVDALAVMKQLAELPMLKLSLAEHVVIQKSLSHIEGKLKVSAEATVPKSAKTGKENVAKA